MQVPKVITKNLNKVMDINRYPVKQAKSSNIQTDTVLYMIYINTHVYTQVTKVITKNLNKVIDINRYPVEQAKSSNLRHRYVGHDAHVGHDSFVSYVGNDSFIHRT